MATLYKRRLAVTAYDSKLAYFAGVIARRDGAAKGANPHYGAEAKAWRDGWNKADSMLNRKP